MYDVRRRVLAWIEYEFDNDFAAVEMYYIRCMYIVCVICFVYTHFGDLMIDEDETPRRSIQYMNYIVCAFTAAALVLILTFLFLTY